MLVVESRTNPHHHFGQAVCAHANRTCATVAVPWEAIWPAEYSRYGWARNNRTYPGEGHLGRWFHCSGGTNNIHVRQQSIAFTHPYTSTSNSVAGFIVPTAAAAAFPADGSGKFVGLKSGFAASVFFATRYDQRRITVKWYGTTADLFAALVAGEPSGVEAVYVDDVTASTWLPLNREYRMVHATSEWASGISFGCHPEYGDVVEALNRGLVAFKATAEYARLCQAYPTIKCDLANTTYHNVKTDQHPEIADHPARRADIVIATEADWGDHNHIRKGVLGGFDIELTKAVCARANRTCAVVTVPWAAVWPEGYARPQWPDNQPMLYPGNGLLGRWFHCAVGTLNIWARQQAIPFTYPYTDKNKLLTGFVVPSAAAAAFPADAAGKIVGLPEGHASQAHFRYLTGAGAFRPGNVISYPKDELWQALRANVLHAVYTDSINAEQVRSAMWSCRADPPSCRGFPEGRVLWECRVRPEGKCRRGQN